MCVCVCVCMYVCMFCMYRYKNRVIGRTDVSQYNVHAVSTAVPSVTLNKKLLYVSTKEYEALVNNLERCRVTSPFCRRCENADGK